MAPAADERAGGGGQGGARRAWHAWTRGADAGAVDGRRDGVSRGPRGGAEARPADRAGAEGEVARHGGHAAARRADARFHHAVATAGHNPEIVRIVTDLDRRINTGFRHDPFSAELFARACADHSAIVAAILPGGPVTAVVVSIVVAVGLGLAIDAVLAGRSPIALTPSRGWAGGYTVSRRAPAQPDRSGRRGSQRGSASGQ